MGKPRMTPIEKIAREICWLGFRHPLATKGKTKASYWKEITEEARQLYRNEAANFIYLFKRVPVNLLNEVE